MTDPIARLRAADPAAGDRRPDERAERDLRLLLTEAPSTGPVTPAPPSHRRTAPLLVTAVVAAAVIALTVAVLGIPHPQTDVGGTAPVSIAPTLGTGACHPAELLPFQCGTYRSTYGGKAITGDTGGPAKDPLSISFTRVGGLLTLSARTSSCLAMSVPVRYDGKRLVRLAAVTPEVGVICHGVDFGTLRGNWAYKFLNGPLDVDGADGPYFGKGDSSVFFSYQGAAPIGEQQLPRNETTCVPAHVAPFSCSPYFSSGGSGSVAFLGTNLFRLSFLHINGQLTAVLGGRCNSLSVVLQPDGNTLVASGGGTTTMLCTGAPGLQDAAVMRFFSGVLTYRIDGSRLTFASGSSSAVFSTDIGACLPSPATSPFCGTSTATSGSGSVAFVRSGPYRVTFGQSGTQLTAKVEGSCATTTYAVTVGSSALRLRPLSTTSHSCPADAQAHDTALAKFVTAPLVWRSRDRTLTLDSAASGPFASVTFTRDR